MGNLPLPVPPNKAAERHHTLTTALMVLQHPLRDGQVGQFRKLVNVFVGNQNDLFHNHKNRQSVIYRYPMVQYKCIEGMAAVLGIGTEGVAAVYALGQHPEFREQCSLWLGDGFAATTETTDTLVLQNDLHYRYQLRKYLPFHTDNLTQWNTTASLVKRAQLVEKCVVGHILKWASAVGWLLPPRSLEVAVTEMRPYKTTLRGASFLALELDFRTNIALPEHIGLGKAVSLGFGVLEVSKK
jgi:hypothetical protein